MVSAKGHAVSGPAASPRPMLLLRAAVLWAACAIGLAVALGSVRTAGIVEALAPFMRSVMTTVVPAFAVDRLEVEHSGGQLQIVSWVHIERILPIGRRMIYEPVLNRATVTVGAFWQPLALAVATAFSWPQLMAGRVAATAAAALLSFAVTALLAPVQLIAMAYRSIYFARAADQPASVLVSLPVALESGLRIAIGLLCGILAVALTSRLLRPSARVRSPGAGRP